MNVIQTSTTHQSGQVTSTGGAADPLDLLARQAQAQETADHAASAGADALPGEPQAVPAMTNAQCILMAGEVIRETLCSFAKLETPKETLSSDKLQPAADAIGAVLDKHGMNLAGVAGDYMAEIKALLITVPLLLACRAGLMDEMQAARAKKKAIEPGAPVAPAVQDAMPKATPHHVLG